MYLSFLFQSCARNRMGWKLHHVHSQMVVYLLVCSRHVEAELCNIKSLLNKSYFWNNLMMNVSILSISVLRSQLDGVKITPCSELNGGLPIPSLRTCGSWILPSTSTSIAWSGRRWGMSSSMSCAVAERERQKLRRRNCMNRPSQRPSLASLLQFLTPILLVAMVLRQHLLHRRKYHSSSMSIKFSRRNWMNRHLQRPSLSSSV